MYEDGTGRAEGSLSPNDEHEPHFQGCRMLRCASCNVRPTAWGRAGFTPTPSSEDAGRRSLGQLLAPKQMCDSRRAASWRVLHCAARVADLGHASRTLQGGTWQADAASFVVAAGLDAVDHSLG